MPDGSPAFVTNGLLVLGLMLSCAQVSEAQAVDTWPFSPKPDFVNTADPAAQGAQEVIADVQSALSWSRFQRGEINGTPYVLFPDGSARVYENHNARQVRATLLCQQASHCLISFADGDDFELMATGAARPQLPSSSELEPIAKYLAEWILAGSGVPPRSDAELPELSDPIEQVEQVEQVEPVAQVRFVFPTYGMAYFDNSDLTFARSESPGFLEHGALTREGDLQAMRSWLLLEDEVASTTEIPEPLIENGPAPLSFVERYNIRCSLTTSVTLSYEDPNSGARGPGKPRASLGCGATLTEQISLRISLVGYAFSDQQEDWDPDLTYAISYRVNETVSISYSNYSGRISGESGGLVDALSSGNLRASFRLPEIELPNETQINCTASLGLPNPIDVSANLSCSYAVSSKFRIGATAYFYFPDKQAEHQADFSYTASYQLSDNVRLSYSNYGNNRWPWNPSESPGGGFGDGSLSLNYGFQF